MAFPYSVAKETGIAMERGVGRRSPPKSRRRLSRVDSLRALDRSTTPAAAARPTPPAYGVGGRPPGLTRTGGGFQTPYQTAPPLPPPRPAAPPIADDSGFAPHPFIPGAGLHPVVPANAAERGSSPGAPNLSAMVMRSFQPANISQVPLVSSGAVERQTQPNPNYNFGGGQLPPNVRSMRPSRSLSASR